MHPAGSVQLPVPSIVLIRIEVGERQHSPHPMKKPPEKAVVKPDRKAVLERPLPKPKESKRETR
jgi:hypothetical protein